MKQVLNPLKRMFFSIALLCGLTLVSFAQSKQDRDVSNFTELSVSGGFQIEITVGNEESLTIEVDDRYIDDVITEVKNGRLVIKMRDGRGRNYRMRQSPKAYLSVKTLESIGASGASTIRTSGVLKSSNLDINLSGASVLRLDLDVNELRLEASGASVIELKGKATEQTIKTNGACQYRAFELESEIADIRVTGAGGARVSVSDKLDVRASGASSIRYKGSPSVNSSTSGASSVKRSN